MSTTQLLFWGDTFLYTHTAKVLEINEISDSTNLIVVLDATVFYPAGGGQPSDTGSISTGEAVFKVTDVKLVDRKTVHHIGHFEGDVKFNVGNTVDLKLDSDKRLLHARLHSAGHLIDSALENLGIKLIPGKGYHYPDGPYVEYIGKIAADKRDEVQKAVEAEVNRLVQKQVEEGKEEQKGEGEEKGKGKGKEDDGKVKVEMADSKRVEELIGEFPSYLPKDQEARMVNVGGVWCPCGGTHVREISQIGPIKITKLRVQKDKTRICYSVS